MLLGLLSAALAAEPYTVVIEGERLKIAWKAFVHAADDQGYHVLRRTGDATIFRSDTDWKPDLVLHDDGFLEWRRQPPMLVTPKQFIEDGPAQAMARMILAEGGARSDADEVILKQAAGSGFGVAVPLPEGQVGTVKLLSTAGWSAEPKKVKAAAGDVMDALREELHDLNEARAALAGEVRAAQVPDELLAIWRGPGTVQERHQRLYTFWDSRTDTPQGQAVREAARAFLVGVVQASADPITPDELAALNATRTGPEALAF